MKELISRLKQVTEGSRELDREIFDIAGTYVLEKRGRDRKEWLYKIGGKDWERIDSYRFPRYTTSIDAALTLVPEGWFWIADNNPMTGGYARLNAVPDIGETMKEVAGDARTPALALCIAALKARE